jgi:Protein of unknown function (DUF1559)
MSRWKHEVRLRAQKLDHSLEETLKLASAQTPILARVDLAGLPPIPRNRIPPPFPVLLDARTLTASLAFDKETHLNLTLQFPDQKTAEQGEKAVQAGIALARQSVTMERKQFEAMIRGKNPNARGNLSELPEAVGGLFGLAMIQSWDEMLKNFPLERQASTLRASVVLPGGLTGPNPATIGIAVGLLLPAVQKVREAANRMADANNLKQIGIAMHNYHDVHGHFPPAAICDKEGKPLLSWRVALLPYLEQNELHKQFKLDEPWDSEHNRRLLAAMPKVYDSPAAPNAGSYLTHYRVFVGPQAGFELCKGRRIAEITDGLSNTWMVVEAAEAVPWTKPDELSYDPQKPLPKLADFVGGGFNAVLMDGAAIYYRMPMPEKTIRALITPAGGEAPQPGNATP